MRRLVPPPIKDFILSSATTVSQVWVKWFNEVYALLKDTGDAEIMAAMQGNPDQRNLIEEAEKKALLDHSAPKNYDSKMGDLEIVDAFEKGDNPTWENRIKALEDALMPWPVGSIFISVVSTNPATLLGFGTWAAFGTGCFLVGIDPGDTDFDTAEETGGAKTHKHSVDVGNTTSGASSDNGLADNNGDGTTFSVATGLATHDVDPAAVDSEEKSNVPPYIVVYMWKRTA